MKKKHPSPKQVKFGFHFYLNLTFLASLLAMLCILPFNNTYETGKLAFKKPLVQALEVVIPTPAAYPTKLNGYPQPTLTTQGAIVIDVASQKVLFEKNADSRLYPASTTKVLTALVSLDYYSPKQILTTYRDQVEGSVLGLRAGDQMKVSDLLKAVLLPSNNDAALVLADNYLGGEKEFVKKMNEKAQELHLTNSHFENPTGLHHPNHYSTPRDLARLATEVLQSPTLRVLVGTKEASVFNLTTKQLIKIENLNQLLGTTGVDGVKTGYTEEAGGCLIATKQLGKNRVISVVLNSQDRFLDTDKLLSFISNSYRW